MSFQITREVFIPGLKLHASVKESEGKGVFASAWRDPPAAPPYADSSELDT